MTFKILFESIILTLRAIENNFTTAYQKEKIVILC